MARPSWLDFLDRLERDGVIRRLDPRTLTAVEELLAAGFADAPADLAAALASLLAGDHAQWQQIQGRVAAFLADHDAFLRGETRSQPLQPPTQALALRLAPEPGPVGTALARSVNRLADSHSRALGWILPGLLVTLVLGVALTLVALLWKVDEAIEPAEPPARTDAPKELAAVSPPQPTPTTPTTPQPTPTTPATEVTPAITTPVPAIQPGPPASTVSYRPGPVFLFALMLVSLALVIAGLRWWKAPRAQRRRAMALYERDSVGAQGPRVIYNVPIFPPFAVTAMDAAATVLARLPQFGHGVDLDVDATLHATVAAGGRTTPVLARTRAAQELTILVDLERGDHPWLGGVEQVLARWAQGGLCFVRLSFEHHPTVLRTHPDRRETNLDALGRRREGTPLIVFARATRLREYEGGHAWLRQLGPWPVRAIVDLDPRSEDDPALLPEEREARRALARAGLRRFPFTAAGLVAMAQHIGSGGAMQASLPDEPLRPAAAISDVLDAWASCLACVPDPSWAQLEVFRREFFADALPDPRHVQRLLDHIAPALVGTIPDDPIVGDGTRINLPRDKLIKYRARLRQQGQDPLGKWRDLEVRASTVILRQLSGVDPQAAGDRRLRDFKVAVHEAILAERDPQNADPGAGLRVFVGDAMEEDLLRWVDDERTRRGADIPDWLVQLETAMDRKDLQVAQMGQWLLPRGLGEVAPTALQVVGTSWLAFSAWQQLPALAGAGGVCVALGALSWWRTRRPAVAPVVPPRAPTLVRPKPEAQGEPKPAAPSYRPPTPEQLGPISAPPTGEALGVVEVALADLAPMRLVGLTGGEFTMGSPDAEPGRWDDEGPQHRVHISPLAVAEHPVTQGQWRALMRNNPSDPDFGIGDDLPVTNITWFEALDFLNRLSLREHRTPCYTQVGEDAWRWDRAADGYRLPTEAEWEFAARAGTTSAYSFGDDPAQLPDHAWYGANSENRLQPVGRLQPNPWRLFDMHGLVWEWTWQPFDDYVTQSTVEPGPFVGDRVLRGGSFVDRPRFLRSANRFRFEPSRRNRNFGFRCVRAARPQP